MPSRYWTAIVALAGCAAGAYLWFGSSGPDAAPLLMEPKTAAAGASITVHVAGEVVNPGLFEVDAAARIADAVAAAGGSSRNADLSRINLAAPLTDGMQVVIPSLVSEQDLGNQPVGADGSVRINVASAGELERLPGVGPVLAGRIASYRDKNGPFVVAEDLLDVPGIGEAKLEAMREFLVLP